MKNILSSIEPKSQRKWFEKLFNKTCMGYSWEQKSVGGQKQLPIYKNNSRKMFATSTNNNHALSVYVMNLSESDSQWWQIGFPGMQFSWTHNLQVKLQFASELLKGAMHTMQIFSSCEGSSSLSSFFWVLSLATLQTNVSFIIQTSTVSELHKI